MAGRAKAIGFHHGVEIKMLACTARMWFLLYFSPKSLIGFYGRWERRQVGRRREKSHSNEFIFFLL